MPEDEVPDKGSSTMHDSWWYGDGWGWPGWLLMAAVMVVFWAVVITLVVLAVRYLTADRAARPAPPASTPNRAEDLLAERFARGEIDDEEYRRRLTLVREHRESP
jgi:putative membrane protein